jgi:hypothetical protein
VTRADVELIADHARVFLTAQGRRFPGYELETEQERAAIIGLHNAIVRAFNAERDQSRAA